jgi:hypothetical protein
MDLVDEDDGAAAEAAASILRHHHDVLDLLDAGEDRAEGDELGGGHVSDHARERRLAGSRRAPEDDRLQEVALDRLAQRPSLADQLVLTLDLVERAWPHAFRQRNGPRIGRRLGLVKQGHGDIESRSRARAGILPAEPNSSG